MDTIRIEEIEPSMLLTVLPNIVLPVIWARGTGRYVAVIDARDFDTLSVVVQDNWPHHVVSGDDPEQVCRKIIALTGALSVDIQR